MLTTSDYQQALKDDANKARTIYWCCIGVLADSDSSKDQADAALRELASAANELGQDAEQIDTDVMLLRERQAAPDLDALERDNSAEARQLNEEAASLDTDAAGAEARAKELRQQAEQLRRRAAAQRTAVNNAKQSDQKIRQQLADRGCPQAMIELAVEEQQRQRQQAVAAVEQAERELAEATAAYEAARAASKRKDYGTSYDPIAEHVEQRQRDVDRAKRALAEIDSRIEVEAPRPAESRESGVARRAKTAATAGRHRREARS